MAVELILEPLPWQPVGRTRALHDRPARRALPAHEQRDADQALVAHHRDLGRCAVLHHVQQRDDGVGRKIDVAQRVARLIQDFAERQSASSRWGEQPVLYVQARGGQEMVLLGIGSDMARLRREVKDRGLEKAPRRPLEDNAAGRLCVWYHTKLRESAG